MRKGLIAAITGVLLAALVVAGCGSSDSDSSSSDSETPSLTKAEFIKQADAICKTGEKSIETGAEKFAKENNVNTEKPTTKQKEEVIVEVVAADIRKQGEEIGELGAPSGDEEKVEAIVAAVEEGADELESEPKLLIEGENPLAKGSKLAKGYGLKVCGEE
jgi:anti-sigma28 factor (negative regulator of flagellin synthesis)